MRIIFAKIARGRSAQVRGFVAFFAAIIVSGNHFRTAGGGEWINGVFSKVFRKIGEEAKSTQKQEK